MAYIVIPRGHASSTNLDNWIELTDLPLKWLPAKGMPKQFEDIPEHIASAASEAWECFSIAAYRAAVQLARSVVEASAKHFGHTRGRLVDKIDAMYDSGMLRPHIREAAHEIRHLGNDMAHGDFVDMISQEEAEECLGLMGEILHEVFQLPARVQGAAQSRMPSSGMV